MKAVVLTEPGQPLAVREVAEPGAGAGMVTVRLRAAALNRRDFWITQGKYPGIQTPCVLGSDGAGEVGGRAVIINPGLNWGENPRVQGPDFRILGMPDDGTFAEAVSVPAGQIHDKPGHLSWEEAAALPLAGLTAFRALFWQGELEANEAVLITGIGGGVSAIALRLANAAGAQVFVTSSSQEKIDRAVSLGAEAGFNYREENWGEALKETHGGVDLILDGAAGDGYNELLSAVKPGGRIVHYGGTAGVPKDLDIRRLFWNQVRIQGSTMGSPQDFQDMLAFVTQHEVKPVVDRVLPLDEGAEAVAGMAEMEQFGKIVLSCG